MPTSLRISSLALAALCLSLTLGACAADSNDDGDATSTNPNTIFVLPDASGEATGASATLTDENGMQVAALDTIHLVGGTSCPQRLGTVTLTNDAATGDMVATLALADTSVALMLGEASVTVSPGMSTDVAIEFTCASTDDISTEITLSLEFGGRVGMFGLPVALDVQE